MREEDEFPGAERRQYIRLDSVFPVQFRLVSLQGEQFYSDWLQGFTSNVSKGGICLAINNLKPEHAQHIHSRQARVMLEITMPLRRNPVYAQAQIAWETQVPGTTPQHLVGLKYLQIDAHGGFHIMRYARFKQLILPVLFSVLLLFGGGFALNTFIGYKLFKANKSLVTQLVRLVQESSAAKQNVKELVKEREMLQIKLQTLGMRLETVEEEMQASQERLQTEEVLATEKINQLNSLTAQLSKEKDQLQEQLIVVQGKESVITEELLRLDKHLAILEKTNFEKMYQWVKIHQNPRTGLVMSFEGDTSLKQWAFMYDQALLIQAYTHFADYRRARKLLDFFAKKAERMEGLWVNAYYANDGLPAEYVVHSGPNIWLGLSIAQYTHKTQDTQYLGLAEEIARKIMDLQDEDPDGGIRGGPQVSWYATEHNLDAYAFFTMLYTLTQKELYAQRSQKVLQWLMQHTYDRQDLPIRRGKGDATIATDTYSWSIAAIGPETLERIEMNPDRILEFAESNCSVEVDFKRPEGESVRIKGFDFAPAQHVGRGGVVSSEWTAQMVMAFKIMSDYSHQKGLIARARAYALKADEYLMNLNKMIISSPSPSGQGEGCLPYATHDFVDTGHGWRTPKGTTTGSVAGTVYALFAYYNYNPLRLNN